MNQPAAAFKVDLRLWPRSFADAEWQMPLPQVYQDYLELYRMASKPQQGLAAARYGWLALGQERVWVQAFAPLIKQQSGQGTLLHLHGFYDHGASYPAWQQLVLQQGWHYLTVDLPGHGLSSGERAGIGDFAQYQALLALLLEQLEQQQFPRPWLLSGFSTGGAIALEHLLTGSQFDRVALIAPLVRPVGWHSVGRWLWLVRLFVRRLPRKFRSNSHDAAFLDFVHHQDPLQSHQLPLSWVTALSRWIPQVERAKPVAAAPLILQGDEDTTVDWRYNLSVLHRLLPEARVALVEKGAHQLLNEALPQRAQVLDCLERWLVDSQPDR
ncbi:alpha/beta hydrolase [Marinospirillum alkaliphilum]|uniref:Lysophospholipase, alpha-beta hydrolase superfamily n=1 Tax=Marinospirillum alkaliphilum DSM 21637 TaxID=1122209 RepID=A0A1K1Z5Y0_9GAMM|nr:alpha/beta hydrolase [Marinospirillum alkaliphilum]SFX69518.1 Lysophospholipase, alpha-beta hydrolase superfamily [Marinospirillum alkaliphilum DSM 21637]